MRRNRFSLGLLAAGAFLLVTQPLLALAPQGTAFTYMGELRLDGVVVDQASDFQFSLFDAGVGGAQIGSTLTRAAVTVSRGVFSVELDYGSSVFAGQERFLEIQVRSPAGGGAYTLLTPRVELRPAPSAQYAEDAGTAQSAQSADQLDGYDAADFVRQGQANSVTTSMIAATILSSLDGVKNDGAGIDLIAGPNVTIVPDDAANTITISASGNGGDADTLDGLDSSQLLRKDINAVFGGGNTLAIESTSTLDVNGTLRMDGQVWAKDGLLLNVAGAVADMTIDGPNLNLNLGNSLTDEVNVGGHLDVSGNLRTDGLLDAGGLSGSSVNYNRIGSGTAPVGYANTDQDLFLSGDLELDGGSLAGMGWQYFQGQGGISFEDGGE